MNLSQFGTIPEGCGFYDFIGGVPQHLSTQVYSIYVLNIVILAVTCPFTVLLNTLTIIAVKIKARLQNMSNITLACLAATDAMLGVLVQPLYISVVFTALPQHLPTSDVCRLQNVTKYLMNFFGFSSLAHLVLMSVDRYMAIKQSYTYDHIVTKTRVLIASAAAWIFSTAILIFHFINHSLFLSIQNSLIVLFMIVIAV